MRKTRSIRSRIAISLVVPLAALAALWGLCLNQTISTALDLGTAEATGHQVGTPGDAMVAELQAERSRSQEYLATGRRDAAALRAQRARTDAAVATFRRLTATYTVNGVGSDATRARIRDTIGSLAGLARVRTAVDNGAITRGDALSGYSDIISVAFGALYAASVFSDPTVDRQLHALAGISRTRELFSQEDALLTGATTAGRFGSGEYLQLVKIVGALRFQIPNAGSELPPTVLTAYFSMLDNSVFAALHATEDMIISGGRSDGAVPISLDGWKATYDPANTQMRDFVDTGFTRAIASAHSASDGMLLRLYVACGAGLVVFILAMLLSFRTGRAVVRRLTALRVAATQVAEHRLPEIMARLHRGEQVDVDAEELRLPLGGDEIAKVGVALNKVHRAAIESAAGEAKLRRGMNQVFVNISRRNQTLINRQLILLEQMRGTACNADEWRDLMLADQLAVRMRRHAEDLVILAGDAPTRGWRSRVPLAEVIRNAIGEVEGGERIEMQSIVDVALPGPVVADVIHLLAELMENATAYSPPHTPVHVHAQRVPNGVCVEVEDRGLGMAPQVREEANIRLSQPPDFDPANSARLGLFVVSQLAARRGLRVSLRPSSYGGITAVVLVPPELIEKSTGFDQDSGAHPVVGGRPPGMAAPAGDPASARHLRSTTVDVRWRADPSAAPAGADAKTHTGADREEGPDLVGQSGGLPVRKPNRSAAGSGPRD